MHSCPSQALLSSPFHHLCCPPLNALISLIFFIWLLPHTALMVRLHQSWVKWDKYFFWVVSYTVPKAIQVGPSGQQDTLLTNTELPTNKTHQILSAGLHSSLFSPSPLIHLGLHTPRCRIWHLSWLNITQLMIAQPCNLSRFPVRPISSPENQQLLFYLVSSVNLVWTQLLHPVCWQKHWRELDPKEWMALLVSFNQEHGVKARDHQSVHSLHQLNSLLETDLF